MSEEKSLSDILGEVNHGRILSPAQIVAEVEDGTVLVVGYEEVATKQGIQSVFKTADGFKFWGAGSLLQKRVIPRLKEIYGSIDNINAAFKANPQMWRFHDLIKLKNGNNYRPIDFLGSAEDFK